MSYRTQALMARDDLLLDRITACASTQDVDAPERWVRNRSWEFSATPGWDASYAYAIAANVPTPGNDEGVITDSAILASVQATVTAEAGN